MVSNEKSWCHLLPPSGTNNLYYALKMGQLLSWTGFYIEKKRKKRKHTEITPDSKFPAPNPNLRAGAAFLKLLKITTQWLTLKLRVKGFSFSKAPGKRTQTMGTSDLLTNQPLTTVWQRGHYLTCTLGHLLCCESGCWAEASFPLHSRPGRRWLTAARPLGQPLSSGSLWWTRPWVPPAARRSGSRPRTRPGSAAQKIWCRRQWSRGHERAAEGWPGWTVQTGAPEAVAYLRKPWRAGLTRARSTRPEHAAGCLPWGKKKRRRMEEKKRGRKGWWIEMGGNGISGGHSKRIVFKNK